VVFGSVRHATNRSGNGGRLALLALFAVLLSVFYSPLLNPEWVRVDGLAS
jgi:hypothetical protein